MTTYSVIDALMASPTEPLPQDQRTRQLTKMFEALHSLERDPEPTTKDWEYVNDAVMLMEALRDMGRVEDPDGLIHDAIEALGKAGDRAMSGSKLRLDGQAIQTLRGVLQDYADVLEVLPARTMISAHRIAESRIAKIMRGQK